MDLKSNPNVRDGSLVSVEIDVTALDPLDVNSNEMDEKELHRLAEEIKETGMISPIQAIPMPDGRFTILGGEHRWRACRMAGYTHVPAVVLTSEKWQDHDLQELVAFRLNSIHGKVNPEKFVKTWDKMVHKFGMENMQNILAVTDDQVFKKLAKKIKRDVTSGLPKELKAKVDDAEKKAKSIDDFGSMLNKIFKGHSDSMKSNFLLFKHGDTDHLMLAVSAETFAAVRVISEFCTKTGKNADEILGPLIQQGSDGIIENHSEDSYI